MPALSSSSVDPAVGHLADLARDAADDLPGLLAMLALVVDPRHRRGLQLDAADPVHDDRAIGHLPDGAGIVGTNRRSGLC